MKLLGVDIFKVGKWKGIDFTEAMLDAMISAWKEFKDTWFSPAVKDGHHKEVGKPALGYVDNLRREGEKIVCDLVDLPKRVYDAIKEHGYDRVSVEIARNLERNGKKYPLVLTALSLLGTEIPEVSGLKPLRDSFDGEGLTIEAMESFETDIFAVWSTAFINDLPDMAFAVIKSGGEKDEEGKTVPRSLRALPHHNANVKSAAENTSIDMPHLRNALSRLPQADLSAEERASAQRHLDRHMAATKTGGNDMDLETLKKELADKTTELKEMTAKLEAAQKGSTSAEAVAKMTTQLTELVSQVESLQKANDDKDKAIDTLQTSARTDRISKKLKDLRVPAFRPFVEEFFNWADESTDTVSFSIDDKKVDLLREQIVDKFISTINDASKALFSKVGHEASEFERKDGPVSDDPGGEVDRLTREYMAKNNITDYEVAMNAVLAVNAELAAEYAKL